MAKDMDTEETETERKALGARNVIARVQYGTTFPASSELPRRTSSKSGILSPDQAALSGPPDLRSISETAAPQSGALDPPLLVALESRSPEAEGRGPTSSSGSSLPPVPGPTFRPRGKSTGVSSPPKGGGSLFSSCFGGPAASVPARYSQIQRYSSHHRPSSESKSPDSNKAPTDQTTNSQTPVELPQTKAQLADSSNAATTADAESSPSTCRRCSSIITDEATGNKDQLGAEQNPTGTDIPMVDSRDLQEGSAGQPRLSDVAAESNRAESSRAREAQAGVSPIRGLRPNRLGSLGQDGSPGSSYRQARFSGQLYRFNHNVNDPGPTGSKGTSRLFDAILGRADYTQSPRNYNAGLGASNLASNRLIVGSQDQMSIDDDVQVAQLNRRRRQSRSTGIVDPAEYTWEKKYLFREALPRNPPKETRLRGQPDPSFNPRPGDIIIRARKRSGLRLIDFYYYDNENHMEQGDQILRAKFDYIPPMDTMYLWCRLYVCGSDGGYTYLDSTWEVVNKFAKDSDVKTFRKPLDFYTKTVMRPQPE